MSEQESVKWTEPSDKGKTRLILHRILGYFIMPESTCVHGHLEIPKGKQALPGFDWPIAYWDDRVERWMIRDIATDPCAFDPLRCMNDAWLVVDLFDEIVLSMHVKHRYHCTLYKDSQSASARAKTAQEAICLAALKIVGIEVVV